MSREARANADGTLSVSIYAKIPRQRDEAGWLEGLSDSVDAKDAPVAAFIRVRESFVDATTMTPQCELYEGFVRIIPSADSPTPLQNTAPSVTEWGATGGPATGSLLRAPTPTTDVTLDRPSSAPASASRPRTAGKGKRRDSVSGPAVAAGGILRICFSCNFFLPLRDFADSHNDAAVCTGCRDRDEMLESPSSHSGRKKKSSPSAATTTKAKGRKVRPTRKSKTPARSARAPPMDDENDDDMEEEEEETTLRYWADEVPKENPEDLAAVAAIWNDDDMDE